MAVSIALLGLLTSQSQQASAAGAIAISAGRVHASALNAVVLQFGAGLLSSLECEEAADANHDGHVNALNGALILQYGAGLLSHLS